MKGIHKEILERSLEDSVDIARNMNESYEVKIPPDTVGQMGLTLFQARMNWYLMKYQEAKAEEMSPDLPDTDDIGRM